METFNIICYILLYIVGFYFTFFKTFKFHPHQLNYDWATWVSIILFFCFWYGIFILTFIGAIYGFFVNDWDKVTDFD